MAEMSLPARIRNIDSNEIHLWFAEPEKINSPHLITRYRGLLDAEETTRLEKFRFEKDRRRYLVARALVRTVLSHYVRLDPAGWKFKKNRFGKPEIAWPDTDGRLRFNLSHTDGMVLVGVTLDHDLGVDVENTSRKLPIDRLAETFFSPAEIKELKALDPSLQKDGFYKYWILKESYLKACGTGLAIPPHHLSFRLESAERIAVSFAPELDDIPEDWRFRLIEPSHEHKAAVSVRSGKGSADFKLVIRSSVPFQRVSCPEELNIHNSLQASRENLF